VGCTKKSEVLSSFEKGKGLREKKISGNRDSRERRRPSQGKFNIGSHHRRVGEKRHGGESAERAPTVGNLSRESIWE